MKLSQFDCTACVNLVTKRLFNTEFRTVSSVYCVPDGPHLIIRSVRSFAANRRRGVDRCPIDSSDKAHYTSGGFRAGTASHCTERSHQKVSGYRMLLMAGLVMALVACSASQSEGSCAFSDADCSESTQCKVMGHCQYTGNCTCRALESNACRSAQICTHLGQCTAIDGLCVATSSADCQVSDHCKQDGWCDVLDDGCAATSTAHCLQSEVCIFAGQCSASSGACLALTDDDCALGEMCKYENLCVASDGVCVAEQ